jgi:hypothetical protein
LVQPPAPQQQHQFRDAPPAPKSMNRHASGIQVAGHAPLVAGVNRKWSGSIRNLRETTPKQLTLPWLHDQQQA